MPFNTRISLLALSAALASTSALAQQSLPTIEVGGAPLRSTSHPPVRAGVRAPGPRVAQAPTQQAPAAPSAEPSEPVSPIVRYAVPTATYTVSGKDFQNTRQFEMSSGMQQQMPGVIINDVGGNPFQPEIDYRGFNASPIAGTPQGLAVYQNGIRINEAWGDNVNWDLIPNVAIGGAVTVDMKNGFTWQGFELDGRFGSRSRRQGTMQYGVRSGDFASYMAMEAMGDKGYRQFSGSNVKRFYGDVGYRGESGEIHANITLGHNKFGASGPAPVELTYIDESAAFTTPQTYKNTLAMYDLNGTFQPSETWKLFGDVHYRAFDQARVDGNTTEFECEPGEDVCENENGGETGIPNYFNGQLPIGAIDRTWTRSRTIGGTVQATNEDRYFGFHNKFTVGVS